MKPLKLVRSQAQEKRTAARMGGKRQSRSGAGPWAKNDVKTSRYLIESKRTDNKSQITIKLADLRALEHNAALESLEPALDIEINGSHYWLVPEWVWDNR